MNCRNCNSAMSDNYCSHCGHPAQLKRIDGHYIQHEITHVLHFEKGIFYTIKELMLRPGDSVRAFIAENRSRLVKPIVFVIVTSLIYTIVNQFFHIEDVYIKYEDSQGNSVNAINKWTQSHYGYTNIIMGIFIAWWLKLFFRKLNYNFYEILILLCFVIGMGMLLLAVFALFEGLTSFRVLPAAGVIYILYSTWAIGQFFSKKNISGYLKAFGAYILGMITFSLLVFLLGYLLDLMAKS